MTKSGRVFARTSRRAENRKAKRGDIAPKRLQYEFSFSSEDRKPYFKTEIDVAPVYCETKTDLILPVRGQFSSETAAITTCLTAASITRTVFCQTRQQN